MLTAREIGDILNYNFVWQINNGKIYQLNNAKDSICYDNLCGELKFNEKNQLELYVEKEISYSEQKALYEQQERIASSLQSGKMYKQFQFSKLEFTDKKDRVWISSRILTTSGLKLNSRKIIISLVIDNINLTSIFRNSSSLYSYSSDNINIIPNNYSRTLTGQNRLNKYELKIRNTSVIQIRKFKKNYIYSIYSNIESKAVIFRIYQLVSEAINIISFHSINYTIEEKYDEISDSITLQINSYGKNRSHSSSLIPSSHIDNKNIDNFISNYVNYFLENESKLLSPLYLWWYRLYNYKTDIENQILILSVAIEALSLKYLEEVQNINQIYDFDEIKEIGKLIKNSDVSKNLKTKVQKYVGNLNSSSKPIVIILRSLVDLDVLSQSMHFKWQSIRNESAHGIERKLSFEDENSLEKILNDSNFLEEVFFRLIFHIIEYTGEFYQFSQYGYPVTSLKKLD